MNIDDCHKKIGQSNVHGMRLEYIYIYIWNAYGICLEYASNMNEYGWNMLRISLEYAWKVIGICMEYNWNMLGRCMEYAWNMHEDAWNVHGMRTEYAWNMHGYAWSMFGICTQHAWTTQRICLEYA